MGSQHVLEQVDVMTVSDEMRRSPSTLRVGDNPVSMEALHGKRLVCVPSEFTDVYYRIDAGALEKYLAMDKGLREKMHSAAPLMVTGNEFLEGNAALAGDGKAVMTIGLLARIDLQYLDQADSHERAHELLGHTVCKASSLAQQRGWENDADIVGAHFVQGGPHHYADGLDALQKAYGGDVKPSAKSDHDPVPQRVQHVLSEQSSGELDKHAATLLKAGMAQAEACLGHSAPTAPAKPQQASFSKKK